MNICELLESTNQQQELQQQTNQEQNAPVNAENDNNSTKLFNAQVSKLTPSSNELNHNTDDIDDDSIHMDTSNKSDISAEEDSSHVNALNTYIGDKNDTNSSSKEKPDTCGGSSNTNTSDGANSSNYQNTNSLYNSYTNNDESNNDDDIDYNKMMLYFSVSDQSSDYSNAHGNNNSHSDNQNDSNNSNSYSSILSNKVDEELVFDSLGPFDKLCKLCENPTPSNIESASKYVVPALEFCTTQDDYERVFSYLRKYCFYSDVLLRSLWLEQIQNVIQYLHQEADNIPIQFKEDFNMSQRLALLISDLTKEQSYQVKKCATTSLIYLTERQLLSNEQIEEIIIPCLLTLVKENNEDFHIDCVSLFGKLARLIGPDLTSKYFLQPFCRLCSSPVFHTRKACASNIVDLANVISIQEVETYLLPHFCEFMKDQVWAIRKVCADLFSSFAIKCYRETREDILTECFIKLLDDNSRWVKISAYKSLGSFIATFSKVEETQSKIIDVKTENENNRALSNLINENESTTSNEDNKNSAIESNEPSMSPSETNKPDAQNKTKIEYLVSNTDNKNDQSPLTESISNEKTINKQESIDDYSNFMYWRNALPVLDEGQIEDKSELSKQTKDESKHKNEDISSSEKTNSLESIIKITQSFGSISNSNNQGLYSSSNSLNIYSQQQNQPQITSKSLEQLSQELKQDIVPPVLLCYFITMVDMNTQNSLDSEMNYNCAYNFPAIALTLGVTYWKYIKDLYKKLAEDVNWKVRQTLSYSIHELAIILGTEYTQSDLVPIFDSYIKDVDEVRIGIVSNLTKFLRILSIEYRQTYMPKLNDLLKMDNQRNWRFRNELGSQISQFCELFPAEYLAEYVQPVAFTLALDKVAEVRMTSLKALVEILRQFELNKKEVFRRNFIDDVLRTFANSNKWSFRQLFVILCENILSTKAYQSIESFSKDFLPKLLSIRNEKVPNIRVLLARLISTQILTNEYFSNGTCPLANDLEVTIQYLSNDQDIDVKSYFSWSNNSSEKTILPPYDDLFQNKLNESSDNSNTNSSNNELNLEMRNSNFIYNCNELEKIDIINNNNTNSSLPSESQSKVTPDNSKESNSFMAKNSNKLVYGANNSQNQEDDEDEVENMEEDEDDDDEDEIIDKTKINQLKIVNLENDLENESTN